MTNVNDSGLGSLRQAILDADADPTKGVDPILFSGFNESGGPPTVALQSPLPAITRPISLDATSIFGSPIGPVFTLDGTHAGAGAVGLTLAAGSDGSTVAGLVVVRFAGDGIDINGAGLVTIRDSHIGVDAASVAAGNGGDGISIVGTFFDTIGGANNSGGNLIGSNGGDGVHGRLTAAGVAVDDLMVSDNAIGTDVSATHLFPNAGYGVDIESGTQTPQDRDLIGGYAAYQGNVFGINTGGEIAPDPFENDVNNTFPFGVKLSVSGSDANTKIGGLFDLTYTLTNPAPVATSDLALDLEQSGGNPLTVVSGPITLGATTINGTQRSTPATIPDLAPGGSETFVLGFQASTPGDGSGDIAVSITGPEVDEPDQAGTKVQSSIVATDAPLLEVVAGPVAVDPGFHTPQSLTFTVTNAGTGPETDAKLTLAPSAYGDSSPWGVVSAVTVSQGTAPALAAFTGLNQPVVDLGPIAVGASATVTIVLTADPSTIDEYPTPNYVQATATSATGEQGPDYQAAVQVGEYVSNAGPYGPGSLRQVILDADADHSPGVDVISAFYSEGDSISLLSALPAITRPVDLQDLGVLDGTYAGAGADGLIFDAGSSGSTVTGLDIIHMQGNGIVVNGASDLTIQGNDIGLTFDDNDDSEGESSDTPVAEPNDGAGIVLENSSGDTIGGTAAGLGNVISSNGGDGIFGLQSVTGALIEGNSLGAATSTYRSGFSPNITTSSGENPLINDGNQVDLSGPGDSGNTIGGTATGAGNTLAAGAAGAIAFNPADAVSGNTFLSGAATFIGIAVSGSAANARVGDPIDLTYTVANDGPQAATHIRLTFDQSGGNPPTLVSGPLSLDGSSATIPDLAPGASETFVIEYPASAPGDGSGTVTASIAGIDQTETNTAFVKVVSSIAATVATAVPALHVTASLASPPAYEQAEDVTYTVTNNGNTTESDARLVLQAGGTWPGVVNGVTVSQGTAPALTGFVGNNQPLADLGSLAPGASATVTLDLSALAYAPINLTGMAISATGETNPGDEATVTVGAVAPPMPLAADLVVAAMPVLAPVKLGQFATLVFLVVNAGPATATDASIAVDLGGLGDSLIVGIVPGQGSGIASQGPTNIYYADLGDIGPGQYVSVTVTFVPVRSGVYGGSLAASDSVADPNPSNNLAFANVVAGMFQVNDVTAVPSGDHVGSILLSFSTDLDLVKAQNINNYHLTMPASKGHKATPVHVLSATYNKAHRQVLLKLASPLPARGIPIDLVVSGLAATDGSVLADGAFSAPVELPTP